MSSSSWIRSPRVGQALRRHTTSHSRNLNSYYQPRASLFFPPYRTTSKPPRSSPLLSSAFHQNNRISIPPPAKSMSSDTGDDDDNDSAVENIRKDLLDFKHDKWGWVIYRCTYADDQAWSQFQQIIQEQSRRRLAESDVPALVADGVEWTFVSDPATLDGVSRDQLRRRFRDWAAEAEGTEQPRAESQQQQQHWTGLRSQRYTYFVQVDEESLRSVVDDADPSDRLDVGWVNFVRADDEDQDFDHDQKRAGEEDGDEGWMMIATHLIGPEFYDAIGQMPEYWYTYYTPPPGMVAYC